MTDTKSSPKCLCCGRGHPETYALATTGPLTACYSCIDLVADVMRSKYGPTEHFPYDPAEKIVADPAKREAPTVLQ